MLCTQHIIIHNGASSRRQRAACV